MLGKRRSESSRFLIMVGVDLKKRIFHKNCFCDLWYFVSYSMIHLQKIIYYCTLRLDFLQLIIPINQKIDYLKFMTRCNNLILHYNVRKLYRRHTLVIMRVAGV